MKRWWQTIVKDYLTFSAKERNGLIILAAIGTLAFLFSRYYPVSKPQYKPDAFQKELASLKIIIDSSRNAPRYSKYKDDAFEDYSKPKEYSYAKYARGETFPFDPNTLDGDGWKRLGVRDKTVSTIQNFLGKGYKFKSPEDLRKIYGLRKEDADRIIPFVKIAATNTINRAGTAEAATGNVVSPVKSYKENRTPKIVDINTADTTAFIALPGIGSKLASRIVVFREKLGGFNSVEQLGETFGLPDSTFQKIKPSLQLNAVNLRKININTAEVDNLRSQPYIRWNIANAIINYRKQHGNFNSIDDLKKIDLISEELFKKIAPYIVL